MHFHNLFSISNHEKSFSLYVILLSLLCLESIEEVIFKNLLIKLLALSVCHGLYCSKNSSWSTIKFLINNFRILVFFPLSFSHPYSLKVLRHLCSFMSVSTLIFKHLIGTLYGVYFYYGDMYKTNYLSIEINHANCFIYIFILVQVN